MIVLLFGYLQSWCQNDSIYPLRGKSHDVTINIDYIRKANIKLIEHKYCDTIINIKDDIIKDEQNKYLTLDSLYKVQYNKYIISNKDLNIKLEKSKKKNKTLSGITIGSVALTVLTLLVK